MRYAFTDIVMQEVPGEISLLFFITGCPLRCVSCHSAALRNPNCGEELGEENFRAILTRYHRLLSCVCFFGGDWEEDALLKLLAIAHDFGLKTCLYTGQESVSSQLLSRLDYLKTGPWLATRGGLDNPKTNQKFIRVADGSCLNALFQQERTNNAEATAHST